MSEYGFIIDGMTWSFSRLEAFYQCPYGWKKRYIDCESGEDNAYAQYGKLCHELHEEYFTYKLTYFELAQEYERRFDEEVTEPFPYNAYSDLRQSYFEKGLRYFEEFSEEAIVGDAAEILGVEKEVRFEIGGRPFVGYIDLLYKDSYGDIVIYDHKSASSKFKKNGEPTKAFAEKMKMYKRQLYLYSKALIDQGLHPRWLCWNFFNDQSVYKIPFDFEEYKEAVDWAENTIKMIETEENFDPHEDWYFCHNICNSRHDCEYCMWENKEDDSQDTSYSEDYSFSDSAL